MWFLSQGRYFFPSIRILTMSVPWLPAVPPSQVSTIWIQREICWCIFSFICTYALDSICTFHCEFLCITLESHFQHFFSPLCQKKVFYFVGHSLTLDLYYHLFQGNIRTLQGHYGFSPCSTWGRNLRTKPTIFRSSQLLHFYQFILCKRE